MDGTEQAQETGTDQSHAGDATSECGEPIRAWGVMNRHCPARLQTEHRPVRRRRAAAGLGVNDGIRRRLAHEALHVFSVAPNLSDRILTRHAVTHVHHVEMFTQQRDEVRCMVAHAACATLRGQEYDP